MFVLAFVLLIAFVMLLWMLEVKLAGSTTLGKNAGARLQGPLFSMDASGTIGKAITYGKWKGRPWARVWFRPHNPKTEKQVNVRLAMALLVAYWQVYSDSGKALWDTYAAPFNMSGFNKFVSRGIKAYIADHGVEVVPASVICAGHPPEETFTWNA